MKTAELAKFAGKHRGESVVLLANGDTLNSHPPHLLPTDVRIMGMNKSWKWLPGDRHADYHVVAIGDCRHFADDGDFYKSMGSHGTTLFGIGSTLLRRYRDIPMVLVRKRPSAVAKEIVFSADATHGVGVALSLRNGGGGIDVGSIGSVAYAALQLAIWLGFHRIYFLGLDLHGPHFHGEWPTSDARLLWQDKLFLHARDCIWKDKLLRDTVRVYNVGSPESRCTAFAKVSFEEAFLGAGIAGQPAEVIQ